MIFALLLAAAPVPTAIDAERAFAADAQTIGQWTAFRKWADRDAVIFTPQAAWAQTALPAKNPPKAIKWAPAHSFVSCDGRTAVNTGPWWKVDGTPGGYFTTVWQRSGRTWRWAYDGGGPLDGAAPANTRRPQTHRASCRTKAPGAPVIPPPPLTNKQARNTPEDNGRGQSADKTLGWDWKVEKDGSRKFRVFQWNGLRYAQVLFNDVPAPPKP
ncbi:MAG: hypothetical protein ACJ8E3_01895 [Sphingomicrobium sp.]